MNTVRLFQQYFEARPGWHFRDFRAVFRDVLWNPPFCLRYVIDSSLRQCFMICTTSRSDTTHPVVRECNGLILECETFRVVCWGCDSVDSLTPEFFVEHVADIQRLPNTWFQETRDGTMLRLFTYNNRWHIATHRRMNAFQAFWSSPKSFGELFCSVWNQWHLLDPLTNYFVLLQHPENKTVLPATEPEVFLLHRRFVMANWDIFDPLPFFKSLELVNPYTESLTSLEVSGRRGILILQRLLDGSVLRSKIDFPGFTSLESLRANQKTVELSFVYQVLQGNLAAVNALLKQEPRLSEVQSQLELLPERLRNEDFPLARNLRFIYRYYPEITDSDIYEFLKKRHPEDILVALPGGTRPSTVESNAA